MSEMFCCTQCGGPHHADVCPRNPLYERIAALEAEVAEDQQEHDRLMAYIKQIKPDAHSVYEVLDSLKARAEQAERELVETRSEIRNARQALGLTNEEDSPSLAWACGHLLAVKNVLENEHKRLNEIQNHIMNAHGKALPQNWVYTDSETTIDLMVAEVLALRAEQEASHHHNARGEIPNPRGRTAAKGGRVNGE